MLSFFGLLAATLAAASPLTCEQLLVAPGQSLAELSRRSAQWSGLEANSEQRKPVELGASPRAQVLGLERPLHPQLYESLRALGQAQAKALRRKLGLRPGEAAEFEAWPAQNDQGEQTWVFARWRRQATDAWAWLDADALGDFEGLKVDPMVPVAKKSWIAADRAELFKDVLKLNDLYAKPLAGDAIWTDASTGKPLAAWVGPSKRAELARSFADRSSRLVARVVAQPPRLNGEAMTFVLKITRDGLAFPAEIEWKAPLDVTAPLAGAVLGSPRVASWPETFDADFERDVRVLSGAERAEFPVSQKRERFTRKNSIDARNQLEDVVDYLAERYERLGLKTQRQRFVWHGVAQSNLIAVIPGRLGAADNHPILMADHIDTAFSENAFDESGRRVSAPGADDNATATAALLRAAEVLRDSQPEHDIWLVHLTGEEFPADDLGARRLIERLLEKKKDIGGLVLLDMIGYRKRGDTLFQINPADDAASIAAAQTALDAAKTTAPGLKPAVRARFNAKSYLYNTDGVVFGDAGYPVILLNEHLNGLENLNRPHYHQTSDTADRVDFAYAGAISRVAIETVARLSKKR